MASAISARPTTTMCAASFSIAIRRRVKPDVVRSSRLPRPASVARVPERARIDQMGKSTSTTAW
jgi:hypothetical protein